MRTIRSQPESQEVAFVVKDDVLSTVEKGIVDEFNYFKISRADLADFLT